MKTPVTDAAVEEYVTRILSGGPLGKVFPCRLSDCDLTEIQREKIRKARAKKRTLQKKTKPIAAPAITEPNTKASIEPKSTKALTKLERILYLQRGTCFFCGKLLEANDASVEHLQPKSRGGTSTDDNEVVCHKSLNHVFANMELKRKFEFVLKANGSFRCPGT